jgi:hypothetical protein
MLCVYVLKDECPKCSVNVFDFVEFIKIFLKMFQIFNEILMFVAKKVGVLDVFAACVL